MRPPVIVPQPRREPPLARRVLAGCAVVLVVAAVSGEVIAQTRLANASAARHIAGEVPACPAVAQERTP